MMFSTFVEDEGSSLKSYGCRVDPSHEGGRREGALYNTVISKEVLIGARITGGGGLQMALSNTVISKEVLTGTRITGGGGCKWPCLTQLSPKRYRQVPESQEVGAANGLV